MIGKRLCLVCLMAFFVTIMLRGDKIALSQINPDGDNRYNVVTYGSSVLGGVEIKTSGVCTLAAKEVMEQLSRELQNTFEVIPKDLTQQTKLLKVSLKKLDSEMRQTIGKRDPLPDAVLYLGGLTSINYVVLVPEENDILLVGNAEEWKINPAGYVVGKVSGQPVLRAEDLVTLFRTWYNKDSHSVISCSINPTAESIARMTAVKNKYGVASVKNARAYAYELEKAYGLDKVEINGVDDNSRVAKILFATDFKMKQIGLGHLASGLRGLPSYLSFLSGSPRHINPRFWLAAEYGTIFHDSQKLAWRLPKVTVRAKTEDQYIDSRSNSRLSSGKVDPAAIQWCKCMDKEYNALSKIDPVFGELRNCMELAMVVALIVREGLLEKVNCQIPAITDEPQLQPPKLPVPKYVEGKSLIVKTIVACGGVEINPFATVNAAKLDNKIDPEYKQLAKTKGKNWWSK
ncbi:MAG: DUF1598 domain-containing protein [Planctomycetaceae bacterium]|nr:DUF1598 domain-containing protein [Planctomycetaceae bacterium]